MNNANKFVVNKTCHDIYDRFWTSELADSPKALSYRLFKKNVICESYLHHFEMKNTKHKIALTRFRLSNHNLLIEKGRYIELERNERKCFICKDLIEDEQHFIVKCPLYSKQRAILYRSLQDNSINFQSQTDDEKFVFIMINENKNVMTQLAKYISNAFLVREKIILYFFS